jgi:glutamate carboxypeptidase
MKKILLSCLLPAFISVVLAQSPSSPISPVEKKITAWIDTHMDSAMSLLVASVNINSGTLNIEGVKKVGALYARQLEKLGFTVEWVNEPDSLHRAGHLVATHIGKKGKRLFLIGHLDTVFEPDMPANPFTMLNDSTATGQGANDMKGGDVVIITALQALQATGRLQEMNVIAYFTGDEEKAGFPHAVARKDFIERARTCDIALGFESAAGLNKAVAARRGASGWKLEVTAKTGHSATIFTPDAGDGAIYEAARVLNTFREQLAGDPYLTFNPGIIVGGSDVSIDPQDTHGAATGKTNIISPRTVVSGDLRFLREPQKDSAREKMRVIVNGSLPGTQSTISFSDGLPSMEPTPGNLRLVQVVNQLTNDMGLGPTVAEDPALRGAGDISDVAHYLDCIDGLGASGKGAHRPGETINLKEYPLLIQRAALLMYRLTR